MNVHLGTVNYQTANIISNALRTELRDLSPERMKEGWSDAVAGTLSLVEAAMRAAEDREIEKSQFFLPLPMLKRIGDRLAEKVRVELIDDPDPAPLPRLNGLLDAIFLVDGMRDRRKIKEAVTR